MALSLTRTINGSPVKDDEIHNYTITNKHVIEIIYRAQKRGAEAEKPRRNNFPNIVS